VRARQSAGSLERDAEAIDHLVREGQFQRAFSLVAGFSALLSGLEVTYEHYKGSYSQRVMYSPVLASGALFGAGVAGAVSGRAARSVLPLVSAITVVDGLVGFTFHLRGVARKPGGWRIPVMNVVMGPPVFAPLLFAISGYIGLVASLLRRADDQAPQHAAPPRRPSWARLLPKWVGAEEQVIAQEVREGRFQRQLAVAAAASALLSGLEALYSHYKSNFRYGAQWTPILLTPPMVAAGVGAAWSRPIARTALPLVSGLALIDGGIGFLYHVRGIGRRPGGFKMPVYNLLYGPPVFAPLLFSASGFLGLLASLLRREE